MRRRAALLAAWLVLLAAPATAAATERYVGETEDGRSVKLVANDRGAVMRGSITAMTDCTGSYDDFRARAELRAPLDRSGPRGFRDKGSAVESDDKFSARYRHRVDGERESERVIAGELDLEVVFRRDGREYTTCTVEDLVFSARRG